jgi:hypothetical protein
LQLGNADDRQLQVSSFCRGKRFSMISDLNLAQPMTCIQLDGSSARGAEGLPVIFSFLFLKEMELNFLKIFQWTISSWNEPN